MQAIADDLYRANRSITAVKLPGGSNTTQDVLAAAKGDSRRTILSKLAIAALGSTAGELGGGAIAILGANAVTAARKAGQNSIDDLVRDALLHPDRAALLLSTRPFEPGTGPAVALMKRYNQASITGASTTRGEQKSAPAEEPRPAAPDASAEPSGYYMDLLSAMALRAARPTRTCRAAWTTPRHWGSTDEHDAHAIIRAAGHQQRRTGRPVHHRL